MFNVTLDTNILVSAFISRGNEYRILRLAKLEKIKLSLSLEILEEFKEVISRPKFGFSQEQINKATKELLSVSEILITSSKLEVVKEDPDDNKILECALDGKSEFIISGDRHLLDLKEYKKIKILTSREFLEKYKWAKNVKK
jgi:putative PIN family toxin of toxin-antitoxin system